MSTRRSIYTTAHCRDYTGGLIMLGLFYLTYAVLSTRPGRIVMALALSMCLLAAIAAAVVHELDAAGIVKQEEVQHRLEDGWSSARSFVQQTEAYRLSLHETLPQRAAQLLHSLHAFAARHAWVLMLLGLCLRLYGSRSRRQRYRACWRLRRRHADRRSFAGLDRNSVLDTLFRLASSEQGVEALLREMFVVGEHVGDPFGLHDTH